MKEILNILIFDYNITDVLFENNFNNFKKNKKTTIFIFFLIFCLLLFFIIYNLNNLMQEIIIKIIMSLLEKNDDNKDNSTNYNIKFIIFGAFIEDKKPGIIGLNLLEEENNLSVKKEFNYNVFSNKFCIISEDYPIRIRSSKSNINIESKYIIFTHFEEKMFESKGDPDYEYSFTQDLYNELKNESFFKPVDIIFFRNFLENDHIKKILNETYKDYNIVIIVFDIIYNKCFIYYQLKNISNFEIYSFKKKSVNKKELVSFELNNKSHEIKEIELKKYHFNKIELENNPIIYFSSFKNTNFGNPDILMNKVNEIYQKIYESIKLNDYKRYDINKPKPFPYQDIEQYNKRFNKNLLFDNQYPI